MSVRITNNPREATLVTHGGNFHADDIFSIVVLELLYKDVVLYRTISWQDDKNFISKNAIVFDVGYGEYDHHQRYGNGNHPSTPASIPTLKPVLNIPYASFGLIWKKFGMKLCNLYSNNNHDISKKLWDYIETNIVIDVDASDNGIIGKTPFGYDYFRTFSISNLINIINPTDRNINMNVYIMQAIDIAKFTLENMLEIGLAMFTNAPYNKKECYKAEEIFCEILMKRFFKNNYNELINKDTFWKSIYIKNHEITSWGKEKKYKPIPMSKFGNLWLSHGKNYCTSITKNPETAKYIWKYVNENLVIGVDAYANGILPGNNYNYVNYPILTISKLVSSFSMLAMTTESFEEIKSKLYNMLELTFDGVIRKALYRLGSKEYIEKKITETLRQNSVYSHILILDKHVHWHEWLMQYENRRGIWFVIAPSNRGGYSIYPVKYDTYFKKTFPHEWNGLQGKELEEVTGIKDLDFIHNHGFVGGAKTLQSAKALVMKTINHPINRHKY